MVKNHYSGILQYFYTIINSYEKIENIKHGEYSRHYILPCILSIYLLMETIFIFLTMEYDLDNPYYFHHIIVIFLPKSYLKQSDLIFPAVFLT